MILDALNWSYMSTEDSDFDTFLFVQLCGGEPALFDPSFQGNIEAACYRISRTLEKRTADRVPPSSVKPFFDQMRAIYEKEAMERARGGYKELNWYSPMDVYMRRFLSWDQGPSSSSENLSPNVMVCEKKECLASSERNPRTSVLGINSNAEAEVEGTIKSRFVQNLPSEDDPCDVCRRVLPEEGNEMLYCDSCDVCVHQDCYGVGEIPEGPWFCSPCSMNIAPECVLCPKPGGAMKRISNECRWAHVSCALWVDEAEILNKEKMEPINISNIPDGRWKLVCSLCRVKHGACIQCRAPRCTVAYHVTCAIYSKEQAIEICISEESKYGVKMVSFCRKHTQNMSSLGKKKRNSTEDKIVAQFPSNTASIDSTTKQAHNNKKFRSYLEELEEGVQSNLEQNISKVNVISEELEENMELESPTSTSKNASDTNSIAKTNEKEAKVKEEMEFSFNLSNPSTTEDNVNDEVTVEKVIEQSMGPNENGNQLLVHNKVTNRAYVGAFLVSKATARKSCASRNNVQDTLQNKVQRIILDKSNETMGNKVQGVTPNKVQGTVRNKVQEENPKNKVKKVRQLRERKTPNMQQQKAKRKKPKTPPKHKVSQSPVANGSKAGSVNSPKLKKQANSNLTLNHLTVTPQNVSPQNNDQNLPSSSTISNDSNLNAFMGYLRTLLQSLPKKKSLKVQKKVVALVLEEHNVSSSDDE